MRESPHVELFISMYFVSESLLELENLEMGINGHTIDGEVYENGGFCLCRQLY